MGADQPVELLLARLVGQEHGVDEPVLVRAREGIVRNRRSQFVPVAHHHRARHAEAVADHHRELFFEPARRSEEHTSELQSLIRISYAVFCLKKKTTQRKTSTHTIIQSKITNIQSAQK